MGLGPTPQDVGTPGLKCYKPTRLQIEIIARTKVESEKAALEEPSSHHGSTTLHVCLYIPIFPSLCANYKSDICLLLYVDPREEEDVRGNKDYGSAYEELDDEADRMLYDQMQGAMSSRFVGKIAATPTTNDAPHSKHDSVLRLINLIYFLLVFS
jgi:hypothetical protein